MKKNAGYYVWEMAIRDRKKPIRQVNTQPLELEPAKQLARIGATKGKHDRSVTTSPRSRSFEFVAVYEAGTGENITADFKANRLVPHKPRRRALQDVAPGEGLRIREALMAGTDPGPVRFEATDPGLPAPPERRRHMRSQGWRFDPDTGESLADDPETELSAPQE